MFSSNTTQTSGGYQIQRSLRFNSADSAYLNRTPASATNRRTWTLSTWAKVSAFGSQVFILGAGVDGDNRTDIRFDGDSLQFVNNVANVTTANLKTTAVYRDPSAWYHIVIAVDSTQATSTNRIKIYVNGVQVTDFATATYFSQNTDTFVNNNCGQTIGRYSITSSNYFNGYMTEFNLIDGSQLTPSSFGQTDAQTGVWTPIAYSGSYGTNGFYLNFSDNSNTTAATLGKDYSGNGNNWTPNNFSVTAGSGNDSLVDSPTSYGTDTGVGGTVRGNYATLNPLKKKSAATISNGNLALVATSATYVTGLSTISPSSGTYYMEMLCSGSNSNRPWGIGVVNADASADASISSTGTYFVTNNSGSTVNYYVAGSPTALSTSSTWVAGDIISLAWNVDSGKFWVGRNGVWYPSSTGGTVASNSDVAAGNYPTFTISYSGNTNPQVIPAFVTYDTTASIDANFGQRPFAYTAPSGFKALCTQNLPTPTIGATSTTLATKYFNPVLYTGNSTDRSITGVGFQPDFTWIKRRDPADSHYLFDSVRGATKYLSSNVTTAETTNTFSLTSFDSDGFGLGISSTTNSNTNPFVAWNWKANGSGSTNTAGSITSTVSANTTSGFSIVTYTGTGANATVGHGLGVAPSMVIVKGRNTVSNWVVWHSTFSGDGYTLLNSTGGQSTGATIWNSTVPTSTVFSVGTNLSVNESGDPKVAYVFAPVAGYSKFGSYTGNGSADGAFIYMGFRPAYVLIKRTDTGGYDWWIMDATRSPANAVRARLYANTSDAEVANDDRIDFVSNGIKLRNAELGFNANGGTYIYACFASNPFKYSLAR